MKNVYCNMTKYPIHIFIHLDIPLTIFIQKVFGYFTNNTSKIYLVEMMHKWSLWNGHIIGHYLISLYIVAGDNVTNVAERVQFSSETQQIICLSESVCRLPNIPILILVWIWKEHLIWTYQIFVLLYQFQRRPVI